MPCDWVSPLIKKVLFIPGSTGPCAGTMFGLTVQAACTSGTGTGCFALWYKVKIDQYDDSCNLTENVTSWPCTDLGLTAPCGGNSNEVNVCFTPNAPNFFTGWANARYKLTITFHDWGDGDFCSGAPIDTLVSYVERSSGQWSTINNPC